MPLKSDTTPAGRPGRTDFGHPLASAQPDLVIFSTDPSYSWRDRIAWVLFVITSFQATFYWPPLILVPGERTRLSTALLCGLSLVALLLTKPRGKIRLKSAESLSCLALTGLGLAGAFLSNAPLTSFFRTSTLLLSGLGGYWCSRLLLRDPVRRKSFLNLGIILLTGFTLLRLAQHFLAWPQGLEPSTKHPTAGLIYVLFFAPLSLVLTRRKGRTIFGLVLMGSGWLLSILMYLKTAMAMPLIMVLAALAKKRLRPIHLGAALLALAALVVILPHFYTQARIAQDIESVYYRAESYPFSWHMVKQNPLLGNGLAAPRQGYLGDYQVVFEPMKNGALEKYVAKINVSENIILTFMADLGLPFTLLYLLSLSLILGRFWKKSPAAGKRSIIPPLALFLPLTAWAVHSLVFDSLLHPQICWFIHILLGLADDAGAEQAPAPEIKG